MYAGGFLVAPHGLVRLLPAVEVVPLTTSAAPVIVRGLSVGEVVGVLSLHVVEASSLVEVCRLSVQRSRVLSVELLKHRLPVDIRSSRHEVQS